MSAVIDFHSHILPGIDDGSASLEESVTLLRMEKQQGITHVIATPHFYAGHDDLDAFLERRDSAREQLLKALDSGEEMPKLLVGAEVFYFRGISSMESLCKLTIQGTSAIMIEMPDSPWPETAWQELSEIYERRGLLPVIAHVDRYIAPFRSYGIPERLSKMPVLVQVNGDCFLRRSTASMAQRLLRQDKIHLLGSDCHNTTTRQPNLGAARAYIQRKLGAEALSRIDSYGADILNLTK